MNETTFRSSEEFISQRKKLFNWVLLITPFFVTIMIFFSTYPPGIQDLSLKVKLFIIFSTIFVMGITLRGLESFIYKTWRNSEIKLSENSIERKSGKSIDEIFFKDISRIKITRDKSGNVHVINVKYSDKGIDIAGFENMDQLAENIEKNIQDKTIIKRKKTSDFMWNPKFFQLFILSFGALSIYLLLQYLGATVFEIFLSMPGLLVGLWLFIYKPWSKSYGAKHRKKEIFVAVSLILLSGSLLLGTVLNVQKENAKTYRKKGDAHYKKGEFSKAILEHTKAIELNSEYAMAYNNRGTAYTRLGEYTKGISDLAKAIELDSSFSIAYNNRGYIYSELKEHTKAISDFNKAIELDPNDAESYYYRGINFLEIDEYSKAISDLTKAIELDLSSAYVYNSRGMAYTYLKEYSEGLLDFNKAIELDQNNAELYINRGYIYHITNENDKSQKDLEMAASLDPQYKNKMYDS